MQTTNIASRDPSQVYVFVAAVPPPIRPSPRLLKAGLGGHRAV